MKKLLPLLIISFLAWLPTTDAQLTISGENVIVCDHGTVSIDISASNFIDITSAQFGITWDTNVISFTGVTNNMPASEMYNPMYTANGELIFSWFDSGPPPAGYTLPPAGSGILFTINFSVVGNYNPDSLSVINIGNSPHYTMEVVSTSGVIPNGNITINPGSVTIDDSVKPLLTCPPNIDTTAAMGQNTVTVNYLAPTITDNCDSPAPMGTYSPISGSSFMAGTTTTVTCTATDSAGNSGNCTFTVRVNPNPNALMILADDIALNCNATAVDIPVRVKNFDDMVSAQFALVWDPTVLEYVDSTDFINVTGHPSAIYNANNVSSGEFRFIWIDANNPAGENLPDSSVIFVLHFTLLDDTALPDVVAFAALPGFVIEFANTGGVISPSSYALDDAIVSVKPDTIPPSITCPADQTLATNASCAAMLPNYTSLGTATDNCSAPVDIVITQLPLAGTVVSDTTDVLLIATDEAGLKDTCTFQVILFDNISPSITCPADQALATNANCEAMLPDYTSLGTAIDNCSAPIDIVITQLPLAGTVISDTTDVMLIATDEAGLKDTCSFQVILFDTIPPSITCPANQLVFADANCEAILPDYTSLGVAADNCTDTIDIVITQLPLAGTVITDSTEVMLIATDLAGLMDTCSFQVTILDTIPPMITCPANDTLDVDSAACFATFILPAASATDSCGMVSITDNGPANDEFPVGLTTVTFTATDMSGNAATCQMTILVNDTIPPVITCPVDTSQTTDLGDCTAVVTWATPTVVDNCTNVTITCTPPSGSTFPVGDSTVVCIVEDPGGNKDTCSFVVTVFDGENPTLDCPSYTTIMVPAGTVDTVINNIYLFFIGDNCTSPVDTSYYHFAGAIPSGGGNGIDASGTAFPVGTTTVTYFGVDDATNVGSCSFDVTIEEDPQVMIACSAPHTVDNGPGICGALVSGVTADAQPSASVVASFYQKSGATIGNGLGLDASGGYSGGLTTVTFFAVSTFGDTVSCSTTVQVNDTELPVFTNCPTDTVTMNNTTDQCGLLFNGAVVPVATDNCPNVALSYNFTVGSLIPVGFNTVVATAMDMSGNASTCTYVLRVVDNQPPTFTNCTNGATISRVNDPNQCGAVVAFSPVVDALDNCSLLAFTETVPGNGSFFPIGNTTVTYTAVDNVGNVATCEIIVTVSDTQLPTVTCPGNQPPVNTDMNQCSAAVSFVVPTASDNCAVISFGPTTPIGPVFAEGVHTVNYVASDAAGNMATCTFTVTVVDNQFPFIPNMPADLTVYTTAANCGANVFWTPPNVPIDNCGIDTFGPSGGAPGDFFGVGMHVVKYVAMDVNGNITVKDLHITVLDTLPPAIDCPAGISISVDGTNIDDPDGFLIGSQPVDCNNIELDFAALMATDACGIASVNQIAGLPSGSPFPVGLTTMTFEAKDNYGNISTCSFGINVLGLQVAPATVSQGLVCEGGTVTFSVGTLPGATYTWTTGNTQVSNQPVFTIANAALNQSGIYTVVVSTAYCDIQFTTELNVSAVPVVTIDADDILCAASGLPLVVTGQNSSTANVNNWAWTFPNVPGNPTGQMQTISNPTPNNSGNYCVTATTLVGCSATACEQVTVSTGPPPPTLFGDVSNLCLGADVTITNATLYGGNNVTYHWYATPAVGSGLLQSINNPIIKPKPTAAGSYTYHLYVTVDGCTSDTAEWVVIVEAAPAIVLTVTGETQCVDGGSNITLMDIGSGGTTWMWSGGPFPVLPGNTNSVVLQNVVPAYSGTYTVVASSAIGCTSSASTQLTFTAAPAAPQLTASQTTICEGDIVTLTGSQYTGVVNYIWTGDGIPPNSPNNNQINVFPPNGPGSYDYGFSAFVNGCHSDTATVTVTVAPAPVLAINVVGDLDCVDGTSSITLSSALTGLSNIEWTNDNGTVLSHADPLVLGNVTSATSGSYYLTASNAQGCIGYGNTTLTISDAIDGLTATSAMADCATATVTLEASSIANASYAWFKPNGQLFAMTQNTTLSSAADGIYKVVASVNGCTDTATVTLNLPNVLKANNKLVLCVVNQPQGFNILAMDIYEVGQPFTINILQQPTSGTVKYFGTDSIYTYTPNHGFWGNDFIIYEICYDACPDLCSTARVTFQVNHKPDECVITTVISPNSDGINDEFVISCVEDGAYPLNTLYIYNQWGDLVYDTKGYKNNWKGTHDARDLPDGTYFFVFQRDPDTPAQKGFVMIYR
ncbi:MAG: HYR domain-containing protein [Saprospiraceae bacterium]|nr:HYR domain-containing protein [Saprospiraceae bacterium]MCF8250746.1 HYR domain-containing protein [Saprospiraceae bacterium]MCF8279803.1 HYR domain-containing protein [Bacteroidales bacterium]MCF8310492.1 HYR domain-containing protein [Saprospiraceae bacterium]MCF8440876.1 HYR domain-containing protein [Saprospiraceae bacterium]